MKSTEEKLYFIAIVPPEPIRGEVMKFKEACSKEYGTKAALRSPPHITLHMPFKMLNERAELLQDKLKTKLKGVGKFQIKLKNFGSFPPRVIYIRVDEAPEISVLYNSVREVMRDEFKILSQDYKEKPFHPHMTIAFRDLKKSEFKRAWDRYSVEEYANEFPCEKICLLEHNGKFWEIRSEINY